MQRDFAMILCILALLSLAPGNLAINQTSHAKAGCMDSIVQFRLRKDPTKCLDVRGGQVTDGAQLQIWDCNGQTNQNFMWCKDGRIVTTVNDNMCLDVPGGDPSKPNNLQLWQCNGGRGQYWEFDAKNQAIFPPSTGEKMCVDVSGGSANNGAAVNIYYCSPGSGEKWYFGQGPPPSPAPPPIPQCSGGKGTVSYFQLNKDPTKCMDIVGGKAISGAKVQIWGCNGQENQKFIWCSDGRIVSRLDDNMCLDVPGGDPSKAANLQIYSCNRADGQYWNYDSGTMSVFPHKTGEKMCMDVEGGSTNPGSQVLIYYCSQDPKTRQPLGGEKWKINQAALEYINV
jgi:hypothetical protein